MEGFSNTPADMQCLSLVHSKVRIQQSKTSSEYFRPSKLFVVYHPDDLNNSEIQIIYADDLALEKFGMEKCSRSSPQTFNLIIGASTSQATLELIRNAMAIGRIYSEFINLHHFRDHSAIPCHIVVNPLSYSKERALQSKCDLEKYAILTIRPASVIGNSLFKGEGLFGSKRID